MISWVSQDSTLLVFPTSLVIPSRSPLLGLPLDLTKLECLRVQSLQLSSHGDLIWSSSFKYQPSARDSHAVSSSDHCLQLSDLDLTAHSASPCGRLTISNSTCSRLNIYLLFAPNLLHLQPSPSQLDEVVTNTI